MTPTVSILLPVRDEATHITACLDSLLAQDHPALEILIAEGGSTDATPDLLAAVATRRDGIVIVPNPQHLQSFGLNLLLQRAAGEVTVRADAHTIYPPDYVRRCVAALAASGADLVGGAMTPVGVTPWETAIAAAMTSPAAVGGARFRRGDASGDTDTVYLGAARTETLRRFGGYRHLPSGVAEDADLAYRIRRAGGRVYLDPTIRSAYRPRGSLAALWRQYRRYGRGKAEMRRLHGEFPSWRPWAPLLLLLGLVGGVALGAVGWSWWPLIGITGAWGLLIAWASRRSPRSVRSASAIATMHLGYGWGLLTGLIAPSAMRGAHPSPQPTTGHLDRDPEQRQPGE